MRLQLVLCDDWHGNTGCLVAQDLALLTKVGTLIHEEISLLTCFIFRFVRATPTNTYLHLETRSETYIRLIQGFSCRGCSPIFLFLKGRRFSPLLESS
jgi:hypothetical protein